MKKLFGLNKKSKEESAVDPPVVQEPPSVDVAKPEAAKAADKKTPVKADDDIPVSAKAAKTQAAEKKIKSTTKKDPLAAKSEHRGTVSTKKDPLAAKSEHRGTTTKKSPPNSARNSPMRNSTGDLPGGPLRRANTAANAAPKSPKSTGAKPNRARSTGTGDSTVGVKFSDDLKNSRHKPGGAKRRTSKRPAASKKSTWEEGIEVIDELLEPGCDTFKDMTPRQRRALKNIKNLLLGRDSSQALAKNIHGGAGAAAAHVPRDLILEQRKEQKRLAKAKYLPKNQPRMLTKDKPGIQKKSSCFFILEEYAGIKASEEDEEEEEEEEPQQLGKPQLGGNRAFVPKSKQEDNGGKATDDNGKALESQMSDLQEEASKLQYVPHEFKTMTHPDQLSLCGLLSWDSLKSWDQFDIFVLNDLTKGNPLLFMGWAVLGSPYAQAAMKLHISGGDATEKQEKGPGYTFMDDFKISPQKLCSYLRVIQQDYHQDNPYHNAIHAADVVQALHSMIQMALTGSPITSITNGGSTNFLASAPKIHLFAILLAAVVHDVDHPGKNNAFQTKVKTELAVLYNDMSVLENWHAACAFARMLDLDLLQENIQANQVVQSILTSPNKDSETNLLSKVSPDEFSTIRRLIIEAVLHTDMTKHFAMVDSAKGLVMQMKAAAASDATAAAAGGDTKNNNNNVNDSLGWNALMYMMHMADISNQAKPGHLARIWTDRCMSEFFAQGKQEATLGLPISPNCDQETTGLPESQVGFIKFVVQPAYEVLGDLIGPNAKEQIVPQVQANLDHWTNELQLDCEDTVCTSDDDDDLMSVDG